MISREFIGLQVAPFTVPVEASRLRFFAKATGQADPLYSDEAVAQRAGHPGLPVPPSFLFCLEMDAPDPNALRERMGIDIARILHGEQRFVYHRLAHAGDRLTFTQRVADLYDKKGGALEFMVRETRVVNQHGEPVADLIATTVIRNDVIGAAAAPAKASTPAPAPAAAAPAAPAASAAPGPAAADAPSRPFDAARLQPGMVLPSFTTEPLTRHTLALYCGASGDHNPIHVDIDFARRAGYPDVFAHGMLSMAWLGRLLTNALPQARLREFGVRFTALTQVGEAITCEGRVLDTVERPDGRCARLSIRTRNAQGDVKLTGDALVAID